jgi:Ran GTPase-activating protein (RanGAP) involved in mRNA processing and transport
LLARSPFLANLDTLDLGFNGLDDAGVAALARSGGFRGLATLILNDNAQISAEGVRALADSPFFGGLAALDVSRNDISDAGVRAVAAGGAFPRLHTLRLCGNPVGDAGVAALVRSPLFGRMLGRSSHLELRKTGVGPAGAVVLAASPALARCTTLDLSENYLGENGFLELVNSPHLGDLRALKLGRNEIPDAAVSRARDALPGLLTRLHLLDLSDNRLTRVGIRILEDARGNLPVTLTVSGNIQTTPRGETPVPVGDVVPRVLDEVAEAAALRRRVSHPAARRTGRPPPHE